MIGSAIQVVERGGEICVRNYYPQVDLITSDWTELSVFEMSGHRLRSLVEGHQPAGRATWIRNGRNGSGCPAPSGMYIFRLRWTDGATAVRGLLVK